MTREPILIGNNDMLLSLGVPFDDRPTQLHIQAHGISARDPLPLLRRAIEAIQAEIDAYALCPVHNPLRKAHPC